MNISLALIVYFAVGVGLFLAGILVDCDKWEGKNNLSASPFLFWAGAGSKVSLKRA